jgi:hypothetical protein
MTQPRYARTVVFRGSQCLTNASNRQIAPICTVRTLICNSLTLIPVVNNYVHTYIYIKLDVNEGRHKNIDDQYCSKLFETQYLFLISNSCLLALNIEARGRSEAESTVARGRLRSEKPGVAVRNSTPD